MAPIPEKPICKKEVIRRVNLIPNLRLEFKWGSWGYFARPAGVVSVGEEPTPEMPHVMRDVFSPDSVKKIADEIGYKEA